MRVLFVANPEKAHLLAMVPVAWALRTAGHDVRFAGQPAFADTIVQAGLTAVPAGRDGDLWDLVRRIPGWSWEPEFGLPAPYDVVDDPGRLSWRHLTEGYAEIIRTWHRPACAPMVDGVVQLARRWRPDLVVWEPLAFAGPVAAKASGAAHARLLWSLDVFGVTRELFGRLRDQLPPGERADPIADWLAAYGRRYGFAFSEDMVTGEFTIDQLPPSLRLDADLDYLPVRYVPYGGRAVIPRWLWETPSRPRIALTMGVSLTDHDAGYRIRVQDVLDALADLDVEVVATIAETEQAKLTRVPANARVVSYVPLHALVPSCAAVIHHGGYGTFLTTVLHGVPQLVVAWDFDSPALARQAARHGATLAIRADEATGEAVRAGVLRILREPEFRERAARLRREIDAMPTPNDLVAELEKRAGSGRP